MRDTTSRGDLTELEIATALARTGAKVLKPLSAGLRYDLAIDNGDGTIVRVQCKTGILKSGFIEFRVSSADARRPNGVPYTGQIEAFAVHCPQSGRSYLIPIEFVQARASFARLRTVAAKNGQARGVRMADAFIIEAARPADRTTKA